MNDLKMQKDELVRRAQGFAISQLDLEAAERELAVAKDLVKARQEDDRKASNLLCCTPLKLRTTTVLLDHPYEEGKQVVVTVQHEHCPRDGDLWDTQVLEVTA